MEAFAGESQAIAQIQLFSPPRPAKDGYEQIAAIFEETAYEKNMPRCGYKFTYVGGISDTMTNLRGLPRENSNGPICTTVWRQKPTRRDSQKSQTVSVQWQPSSVIMRSAIANCLANIEQGIVFSRDGDTVWVCRNCGHIVIGKNAPEECPVCAHARSYFEIEATNY